MEHCQIRPPGEIKTSGLMLHILVLAAWIMCSEAGRPTSWKKNNKDGCDCWRLFPRGGPHGGAIRAAAISRVIA